VPEKNFQLKAIYLQIRLFIRLARIKQRTSDINKNNCLGPLRLIQHESFLIVIIKGTFRRRTSRVTPDCEIRLFQHYVLLKNDVLKGRKHVTFCHLFSPFQRPFPCPFYRITQWNAFQPPACAQLKNYSKTHTPIFLVIHAQAVKTHPTMFCYTS
jgi:hypothetical protein